MEKVWNLYAFLFLLFTVFVSCSQSEQSQPNSDSLKPVPDSLEKVLLERVNNYYMDFSSREWKSYAEHFWPGAYLATLWQPPGADTLQVTMTTIEEFIARADQGPGSQPIFEEKMIHGQVRAYNNLATVWAKYSAKFGSRDSLMEWEGIDAFTYMKHEGHWRIISLAYTQMQ
jgi:hypothetical protein